MRSDGDAKRGIATATADHTKHGLEATIWRRESSRRPQVQETGSGSSVGVYSTYVRGSGPRGGMAHISPEEVSIQSAK